MALEPNNTHYTQRCMSQRKKIPQILVQPLKDSAVVAFSILIVWMYASIALNLSFLNPFADAISNFSMTDKYYLMMPQKQNHNITIVDLTHLYSRQDIAMTLHEIEAFQPAVIGLDCVFEGEKEDPDENAAIIEVARSYDNIVYSYRLVAEESGVGYTKEIHSFFTDSIQVHQGVTNMPRTNIYNSVKRKLQMGWLVKGEKRSSFITEVANIYAGTHMADKNDAYVNINFTPTHFAVLSPDSITFYPELIQDHIVLFGTMTDEGDMHYTPLGKMAGVELLAYSAQTILEKQQIRTLPNAISLAVHIFLLLLTYRIQREYARWTASHESPFICHILGSSFFAGLITSAWTAFVVWLTYICFCTLHYDVKIEWTIASIAFLSTAQSLYKACEAYYLIWKKK